MIAKIIWFIAAVAPASAPVVVNEWDWPWLESQVNKLDQLEWLLISIVIAVFAILVNFGKRAKRLHDEKIPSLVPTNIKITEKSEEFYCRVRILNTSSNVLIDIAPYLESIDAPDPAEQIKRADLSAPLYSKERFPKRQIVKHPQEHPALPIKFRNQQPKWIHVFHVSKNSHAREVLLYVADGVERLMGLEEVQMKFKCSIYSIANPVNFLIIYRQTNNGFAVTLMNDEEVVIDRDEYERGE